MNDHLGDSIGPHFEFQIPGLTEQEEDVVSAFMARVHDIAFEEGHPLSLLGDGAPILVWLIKEMLPDYTQSQMVALSMRVIDSLGAAINLSRQRPEGSA